jgi:hypothetical protein
MKNAECGAHHTAEGKENFPVTKMCVEREEIDPACPALPQRRAKNSENKATGSSKSI